MDSWVSFLISLLGIVGFAFVIMLVTGLLEWVLDGGWIVLAVILGLGLIVMVILGFTVWGWSV